MRLFLASVAVATLGIAPALAQEAASATARLEPGVIGVGQTATLTIEARGSGLADLELDPRFALDNLEIVSGPMQSQNWQFINGRASRSESLVWRVRGQAAGPGTVGRIKVTINDTVFELPDQVITVQQDPVEMIDPNGRSRFTDPFESLFERRRRPRARQTEPKLFLRAEVSPENPYVGQQVLYTLYLFTQADVGSVNTESMPTFEGFWVEDVPQPEQLRPEMVDVQGQRFGRAVLLRKAVFPMRPGKVELEPVRVRLIASFPEYSWLGSVIDRRQELFRTSNSLTLDVKPLPEAPVGFRGAVGKLELSAQLEPREVRVGEASTLIVKLEGQGNIQGVAEPKLPVLEGVRVFPPEQASQSGVAGTRVRGEKSWKYVLVPDRAGEWQLPPLSVDYFDPYQGSFESARAEPATFTALAPLDAVPNVGSAETTTIDVPEDAISKEPSGSGGWGRLRKRAVIAGSAVVTVALLLLPVARISRKRSRSNRRLCERLRSVNSIPHGRRAAEALEDAWREFLEQRYALPAGTAATQWAQALRTGRLKAGRITELGKLIEDLEYLRYAPELSASESLIADLIARSLKLARGLR